MKEYLRLQSWRGREGFNDHYPCSKQGCRLSHVWRWLYVLCRMHNKMRDRIRFNGVLNLMKVVTQVSSAA